MHFVPHLEQCNLRADGGVSLQVNQVQNAYAAELYSEIKLPLTVVVVVVYAKGKTPSLSVCHTQTNIYCC